MAEEPPVFSIDPNRVEAETSGRWYGDTGDWMMNFGASALSAMPELLGISPSEEVERWRMSNPIAGLVSELGGTAVPYLGWAGAARKIGALEKIAQTVGKNAATRPFTALGGAEAVRFLPFEVGRVAASQIVGDKSLAEMSTEAAVNLTLGSVFAGGLGVIGAAGKAGKGLAEVAPQLDTSLPPQLLMRKIDEVLPSLGEQAGQLSDHIARLDEFARGQTADRYVAKEISGEKDTLDRLFRVSSSGTSTIQKRRPVSGDTPDTFATPDGWQTALRDAGLEPSVAVREAQYPRLINFNEQADFDAAARRTEKQRAFVEKHGDLDMSIGTALYHGSPSEQLGANLENFREGIGWFTPSEDVAKQYAKGQLMGSARATNGSGMVYKAEIDLGKNLDLRLPEHQKIYDDLRAKIKAKHPNDPDEWLPPLKAEGFIQSGTGLPGFGNARAILENLPGFNSMTVDEGVQGISYAVKNPAKRVVKPTAPPQGPATKAAARVEDQITKALEPVGDGWYVKREPDEGLYVMARKYRGDMGAPSAKDAWVMFKTDRPQTFVQKSQIFMNAQVAREKWITGRSTVEAALAEADTGIVAGINKVLSTVPYEKYREASHLGGSKGVAGWIDKMPGAGAVKGNKVSQQLNELARTYLAPANRALRRSTRGNYTLAMGKAIQDTMDNFTQEVFQGTLKLDPGKNALRQLVMATEVPGTRSVQTVFNDLEKDGLLGEFTDLLRKGIGSRGAADLVAKGQLRPRTLELVKELEGFDARVMTEMNRLERAAGKTQTKSRQGHMGLPRVWDGTFMQAVRNEAGHVVGIAGGHTVKDAEKKGLQLAAKLREETGRPHHAAQVVNRNQTSKIPPDMIPFVTRPGFTLERQNVRGFKWDLEEPTKQELLEAYNQALRRKAQYMGSLGREAFLGRHVAALSAEDPVALGIVSQRFNAMSGVQGEFTKTQNRIADKILAPYLGSNSASRIVEVTNKGLMHLQLGMGKLGYPISNVVGVVQVVAPEVAFISRAAEQTLAGAYHLTVPMVGSRGTVGAMSVLNPLKIMGGAFRETAKPTAQTTRLLERAVNERAIDARIIEDFVGQNRTKLTNFRGAVKSPGDFARWVGAASEFLPATSERFARVYSFNAGVIAARDIMKWTDEDQIYRFAKQFLERTNYLYSSADRPLVFTSPLGSSMGLFKNWMMNYMASMVEYTNVGLTQNLWSPLVWQTLGTFAVGGAAATPIYWAAEGASRIFADKSLMQWSYDEFSQGTSDALMYGLPAALTGVSLSSQMTSPGANPIRDAAQLFSFAAWDRAKNLGQAAGAGIDHWRATGEHPGGDPDVRNHLIKAFAPVNLYRTMATQEEGLVRNLATDLPTAKGLSWMDIQMYRAGLQPLAMEKQLTVANEIYASRQKMRAAVTRLGDTFYEAMTAGDSRMMDRVIQQALLAGVDVSAVLQSGATRTRNAAQTTAERLSKPGQIEKYENVLRGE